MPEPSINKIIAETGSVRNFQVLKKKSLDLAHQLGVDLDFRAYIHPVKANADELSGYIEKLSKFQKLLSGLIQQAEKKKITCKAAVLSRKPHAEKSHTEILMQGIGDLKNKINELHMTYVVFDDARTRNNFERTVIIAGSDLHEDQIMRLKNWCSVLASANIEPNVVVIQGRTGLEKWESLIRESELNNVTIDMLQNDDDLQGYIKKIKARLICLPYQTGRSRERLTALHKLNRADLLLF